MSNLTDFLLARIADDEASARALEADLAREFGTTESLLSSELALAGSGYMDYPVLTIDSTRVLAECEAKRRIVTRHKARPSRSSVYPEDVCLGCGELAPCANLRDLAAIHADHPDYREEWCP